MGYKYLLSLSPGKHIKRIKEGMRRVQWIGTHSMPMTDDGRGPRSLGIRTESAIRRNIARKTTRFRFRSCGIVGYGPTLNQGGDIQCDHDVGFVKE